MLGSSLVPSITYSPVPSFTYSPVPSFTYSPVPSFTYSPVGTGSSRVASGSPGAIVQRSFVAVQRNPFGQNYADQISTANRCFSLEIEVESHRRNLNLLLQAANNIHGLFAESEHVITNYLYTYYDNTYTQRHDVEIRQLKQKIAS